MSALQQHLRRQEDPQGAGGNDRGAILLLALLIMSSILVASVGLAALILSSLQQSRAIDSATVAYYAAETGVEESLYETRRQNQTPGDVSVPQVLSNASSWTRDVSDREAVVYAGSLAEDATLEVALYDPEMPTASQNIGRVQVTWTDDCGGCTVLQSGLVGWLAGGPVVWNPNAATAVYPWTAGGASIMMPDPGRLYRLRLNARKGAMQDVQIRAYDGSDVATTLPGRIKIDSIGYFGNVRQKLTATLPRDLPLAGLYDFVIFSECSLVKGGAIGCP